MIELYNYWIYVVIMMIGFYGVIARKNLVKKVISLGLFQTGIFILYISMSVRFGAIAPVIADHGHADAHGTVAEEAALESEAPDDDAVLVASPLPHVLILTAIVVSVSVTAVALSVVVRIRRAYGTVESDEIEELDRRTLLAELEAVDRAFADVSTAPRSSLLAADVDGSAGPDEVPTGPDEGSTGSGSHP